MPLSSPNIRNYVIGKGEVSIRRSGETNFTPLGNCPTFEFTPTVEKLDHFSSQSGVKTKDKTVVLSQGGSLKIVMEEWTAYNMALALMGTVSDGSGGDQIIQIMSSTSVRCEVKFQGANDVGPKAEWYFGGVDIIPSSAISVISDGWASFEITGDVSAVNGVMGTVHNFADGAA